MQSRFFRRAANAVAADHLDSNEKLMSEWKLHERTFDSSRDGDEGKGRREKGSCVFDFTFVSDSFVTLSCKEAIIVAEPRRTNVN